MMITRPTTGSKGGPRKKRQSGPYGGQLAEKQNLKGIYGIRDEQLKKYFRTARRQTGNTGEILMRLLEMRLDNAIYRAGLALNRGQARQMASHQLFEVNGRSTNIPSMLLKQGDEVRVKAGKREKSYFKNFEKRMQNTQPPGWITLDVKNYGFKISAEPMATEMVVGVEIQAVVELLGR